MIGRDDERAVIFGAVEGGASAVVAGAPGVGKTRLVWETVAALPGVAPVWIRASALASEIPFAAVAGLFPPGAVGGDQLALFCRAADLVVAQAGDRRPVVAVDDAHLLDAPSAALVHHLALSRGIPVVATLRSDAAVPDAIRALWREGGWRVDLQPLAEAEVGAVVEAALDGQVAAAVKRWMFERSDGNPLVLRELLLVALDTEALVHDGGLWRLVSEPAAGPRLVDLVRARLGALDPAERQALELVALAEPLPRVAVERLVPPHALEALERRGTLITERLAGEWIVRTAHPLDGELLRAELPPATTAVLQSRLADALAASSRPRDVLRAVSLRLSAGEGVACDLLDQGATEAQRVGDRAGAERLAAAALAAGAGVAAAVTRAEALVSLGRHQQAQDLLAEIDLPALPRPVITRALRTALLAIELGLGRTEEALRILNSAATWQADDAWARFIVGARAQVQANAGRFADAIATGLPSVDGASPSAGAATPALAFALVEAGRTADAEALIDRHIDAGHVGPASDRWLVVAAMVRISTGRAWDELDRTASTAHRRAVRDHDDPSAAAAALALGQLALERGKVEQAAKWLRDAAAGMEVAEPHRMLVVALAALARAEALAGTDTTSTQARLRSAVFARPPTWVDRFAVARAEVWMAVAAGELGRARQLAVEGAAECGESVVAAAHLLHDALRLGEPPAALAERLGALADHIDVTGISVQAFHAASLARGDGPGLDLAADRFEKIGALLHAAESASAAAAAHRAAGRTEAARVAAARSQALAARCEGARTPALGAGPGPVTLSQRELEVAALAARGMSNAAIAERLILSVRTVESHLYRCMTKLGVGRREALAPLLGSERTLQ
ncbi:LuxR family transcriptional regulator [soil metagenome]